MILLNSLIKFMKKKVINTHLTLEARMYIENSLNESKSITEIANDLHRDRSNIRREILKHRRPVFPSSFNKNHPCLKHKTCGVKSFECYLYCKMIETNFCEKLVSNSHVCNGCPTKHGCRHVKYYYKASEANSEYNNSWHEDRIGMHYTEEELDVLNTDFKYPVLKNKSVYHSLIVINSRGFNFKLRTIYKQIESDKLAIKLPDLPRKRKTKTEKIDTTYKRNIKGCSYEDYLKYKEEYPNSIEIQMDTVEGIKENNAPVILTLQIVKINFLFMFKLDSQTNEKVIEKLILLRTILTKETFTKLMDIVLTDNGKEFIKIEQFNSEFEDMHIFYCHPYSSFEKGNIENNHELIRRVIPKGVSLKCYTQKDLDLLCSHINSLYRKNLSGKCPFDLVVDYLLEEQLSLLNLHQIKPEDIELIPELLGTKNIDNIKKHLADDEIKRANINFLNDKDKEKNYE